MIINFIKRFAFISFFLWALGPFLVYIIGLMFMGAIIPQEYLVSGLLPNIYLGACIGMGVSWWMLTITWMIRRIV